MLLEYALQTILILPSAVALLLATCLLSVQLFVVPLHFLPDAVVTRLRRSPASTCYASDSSLVKAYDFVVVGGTLSSHVWFMRLRWQHPKASILLLEPPLLDYRSLIFTFFAGLDIGVSHNVPYFRAYPFYRASSTAELAQQANPKLPYVRLVVSTFEMLINELARDLAAHEDPAIKLPCYRIVQRVDPSTIENGAIGCRHVFPIQYSSLRNEQNLKVLLGVESITWLGNTRDRRLAVQVNIQNQDQPFVFYVNRDLHLFDTINATGSTEPSIHEHQFDQVTDFQRGDADDDDDEDDDFGINHDGEKVGNSLHQCFYAFRRTSVDEDSCALWTFDLAEEFDGDPSSDPTSAIEILVGFAHASSTTTAGTCSSSVQQQHDKAEFFETATSFKVLPLTQVTEGWVGLEIQQTVYNDSKHHLMHWGYEIIQRVFDSLNSDGIVDIHSDTASVNTIPQSPGLSPTTATTTEQEPLTPTTTPKRHSEMFPHYARVHRPTVDHLVVKDDGPNAYLNNKNNNDQQHRLPSYLSRIWNLVFVEQQHAKHNVSELLADPSMAEKHHPFSATFARLLQSRATCFQQNNQDNHPAILRSTTVVQSRELHRHQLSEQQQQQEQGKVIVDDDDDDEEENDGRRSSYESLSDLAGNYYSPDPYKLVREEEEEEDDEDDDDDDEEEEDDDDDTATATTSEEYEGEIDHSQSSSSESSSSDSSSDEASYDDDSIEVSNENSAEEDEEEEEDQVDNGNYDEDQLVDMSTDEEDHFMENHHPEYTDANDEEHDDKTELDLDTEEEKLDEEQQKLTEQQQQPTEEFGEEKCMQSYDDEEENQAKLEGVTNTQQASDVQEGVAMEYPRQQGSVQDEEEDGDDDEENDNVPVKETDDTKPVEPQHDDDTVAPAIEAQSVNDTPDTDQEMIDDEVHADIEDLSSPSPQQPAELTSDLLSVNGAEEEVVIKQEEQQVTREVAAREDNTDEPFSDGPAQEADITTPPEEETPTPSTIAPDDNEEKEPAAVVVEEGEEQQPMSNSKKKRKAKKAKKRA